LQINRKHIWLVVLGRYREKCHTYLPHSHCSCAFACDHSWKNTGKAKRLLVWCSTVNPASFWCPNYQWSQGLVWGVIAEGLFSYVSYSKETVDQ